MEGAHLSRQLFPVSPQRQLRLRSGPGRLGRQQGRRDAVSQLQWSVNQPVVSSSSILGAKLLRDSRGYLGIQSQTDGVGGIIVQTLFGSMLL